MLLAMVTSLSFFADVFILPCSVTGFHRFSGEAHRLGILATSLCQRFVRNIDFEDSVVLHYKANC